MLPEQAQALVALPPDALERAVEHLHAHDSLRTRLWLDRSYPSDLSLAILDCAACRLHFRSKFPLEDGWLLSREAAEQATAYPLARWRAGYLKQRFPNLHELVELGTGIGGDSVPLSHHFAFTGYEQQAERAILAQANLVRLGGPEARVIPHRIPIEKLCGELLFADPARRSQQGRSFDPEEWDPPLSSLLQQGQFSGTVFKTAPGLDLSALPEGMEVHFLSLQGDLKEAMLLRGSPTPGARLNAWLWSEPGSPPLHRVGDDRPAPTQAPGPGAYLLNPDPSLVRCRGLAGLAEELGAGVVHPRIAYLCGPRPCRTPWADSFHILDSMALDWGRLNAGLAASGWNDFEYLGRGVPFSQAEVLTRLKKGRKKMSGQGRGAVIIYRDEHGYRVCLAHRLPRSGDPDPSRFAR